MMTAGGNRQFIIRRERGIVRCRTIDRLTGIRPTDHANRPIGAHTDGQSNPVGCRPNERDDDSHQSVLHRAWLATAADARQAERSKGGVTA